jgi:hypothetical protein
MRRILLTLVLAVVPSASIFASCGGQADHPPPSDAFGGGDRLDAPYFPDASCAVKIESPPLLPGNHVDIGTDITTWDSNPPSSGDHYPIWAAFQEYTTPVPRGYYVHDLEHGAVVLLYNCSLLGDAGLDPDGGDAGDAATPCDALVAGLRQVVASMPTDPLCDPSIRVRYVLTPDPLIAYPVAAAAWGWTYNASCLDVPTLEAFAQDHYAQGPEDFCGNGQASF